MSTKARTTSGSNCEPEQRCTSAIAFSNEVALAVRAVRRHRVQGVGHGEDPGTDVNLLAAEPPGVAAAVEALLV